MTIVNCHFYNAPETGSTLTVERWGAFFDGNQINPRTVTKPIVNGQASVSLFPGNYLFTAISHGGRVFYSQQVKVPDSITPVDLWDIANQSTAQPSQIDQSINAIASRVAIDPEFISEVASQVPVAGAQEKRVSFTDADLSISGLLTVVHNFGKAPRSIRLRDSNGWEIEPDETQDNGLNTTVINLGSLRPLLGSWTAILGA